MMLEYANNPSKVMWDIIGENRGQQQENKSSNIAPHDFNQYFVNIGGS